MSNVNPETGEVVGQGRSPRFTLWVAFLVFATITMGSAVEVVRCCCCCRCSEFGWVYSRHDLFRRAVCYASKSRQGASEVTSSHLLVPGASTRRPALCVRCMKRTPPRTQGEEAHDGKPNCSRTELSLSHALNLVDVSHFSLSFLCSLSFGSCFHRKSP